MSYFITSIAVIVIFAITMDSMAYASTYPSPLKQFKAGILLKDIKCNNDLSLLIKLQDSSPHCVKPTSVTRLLAQGWILVPESKSPNPPQMSAKNVTTLGIILVPYFEPIDPQWNVVYQYADLYPDVIRYAIINPCSGPCVEPLSKEWQSVIFILQSKGIKTLGYIFDNSQSVTNIDYYMKEPEIPTSGIFFDNEGTRDNFPRFKQYADYVHALGGIVYINPGYNYPHVIDYIKSDAVDIVNIHEVEAEKSNHILVNDDLPPSKLSVILGNISTTNEMKTKLTELASKGIGTVYFYANSYDTLPTYFAEEIQSVSVTPIKKQ